MIFKLKMNNIKHLLSITLHNFTYNFNGAIDTTRTI
jgi:hypothetical protein